MDKTKHILTNLLIAFALISLGYSLGKHFAGTRTETATVFINHDKDVVRVYYMHATFRCVTCNTIESMTRDLLDRAYADSMAHSHIQWEEIDFQENEVLAKQFDVIASCVVVAKVSDGQITEFKRLDEVWTLMKNQKAFDRYVSKAIDSFLLNGGEGS